MALACLALGSACGRPGLSQQTDSSGPPSHEDPPFHQGQYRDRPSSGGDQLTVPPEPVSPSAVPFRSATRSVTLPSGTLLTVQLDRSLNPAQARAGDPFTASVAGPVTIDGETVIEPGTAVRGRVESAQAFSVQSGTGRGYVRLILTAIVIDNKQLPLQTASLFAGTRPQSGVSSRGYAAESQPTRVQKGRRLTFRLTTSLSLDEPTSIAALGTAK